MSSESGRGFVDYAETAPSDVMKFFAKVAVERGLSMRTVAMKLDLETSTVLRHLRSKKPKTETIARWAKALGLADRAGRVKRGPEALTDRDLLYYRELLLRSVVVSDEYADFAEAVQRIEMALDGSKPETQRDVLHAFASKGDVRAAVALLVSRTGIEPPNRARFTASDSSFWMIAAELRDLGLSHDDGRRVLDFVRERLGRDSAVVKRNDAYLAASAFGALVVDGDSERSAVARAHIQASTRSQEEE